MTMSVDVSKSIESVSSAGTDDTNISKQSLKPHNVEQWERNLIGNFLLTLYHRLAIGPHNEWSCLQSDVQEAFSIFITTDISERLKSLNGTDNIGILMKRCGFLEKTPSSSLPEVYKIRSTYLLEFRHKKLKEHDLQRTWSFSINSLMTPGVEDILKKLTDTDRVPILEETYKIDENSPEDNLQYQGTLVQKRRQNYRPTNMSCCICQLDFTNMEDYEEHIQIHNSENDFEFLKELTMRQSPIFTVSYRLCQNSHHFAFMMKTMEKNLIIEKIIIVQSRSMFYVNNMNVPYAMPHSGSEEFFIDSHLFTMFLEQPIIFICHLKNNNEERFIEEHHFMRSQEFPKVNFNIRPCRLPSNRLFKTKFKVPDYLPPKDIRKALEDDFSYNKLIQLSRALKSYIENGKELQPETMGKIMTLLLQIEDFDTVKMFTKLIQFNVKLQSFGDDFSMKLNSKRASHAESILSVHDEVLIVTRNNIKTDEKSLINLQLQSNEDLSHQGMFLGQIEAINGGRISFKYFRGSQLPLDLHRTYTILFRPARLQLRYKYRAMELLPMIMKHIGKFLFPQNIPPMDLPKKTNLNLYNKSIECNPEQSQAVHNIASGPRNDATYIIFGPPGTGKTTTVVEAILQVLKRNDTKILVTAPSNSACDELALRLCKTLNTIDMSRSIVRIYARSNESRMDTINELLLEHSNMYNGHFYPDVEILHEYRIIVCTTSLVSKLATGQFGRYKNGKPIFTHMFIDEVAAATEVESLSALSFILSPETCLIISGDHKQLGPIINSKRAEELKLDVSLMERLLDRECYHVDPHTGEYDRSIQTRLRKNFRSHPSIVKLYSDMYYNSELEAKANIDDVSLAKYWHLCPNKDFPIIFHSIKGQTLSDKQSFSLYNADEVKVVMDYIKDLMYFGINGKAITETDIGIISPYKKQFQRFREELNMRRWYQIETGSVETFQGKEKEIIIVSFVRSESPTLGFLDSDRRLNVTLSRAKSLLILVGNIATLSMNPNFYYIIKECQRHGTLIGDINILTENKTLNTIAKNLQNLKLDSNNNDITPKQKRKSRRNGNYWKNTRKAKVNSKITYEVKLSDFLCNQELVQKTSSQVATRTNQSILERDMTQKTKTLPKNMLSSTSQEIQVEKWNQNMKNNNQIKSNTPQISNESIKDKQYENIKFTLQSEKKCLQEKKDNANIKTSEKKTLNTISDEPNNLQFTTQNKTTSIKKKKSRGSRGGLGKNKRKTNIANKITNAIKTTNLASKLEPIEKTNVHTTNELKQLGKKISNVPGKIPRQISLQS
ncbi:uncharacterized protein LOC142241986 [Haematobia irritans]|uniref:uncharacterized protein LOC142241986 n=1 Tax=Haematobia irritans TaxID=7368 RepID=UPI003F503015